jgi:hypothetical protein
VITIATTATPGHGANPALRAPPTAMTARNRKRVAAAEATDDARQPGAGALALPATAETEEETA